MDCFVEPENPSVVNQGTVRDFFLKIAINANGGDSNSPDKNVRAKIRDG